MKAATISVNGEDQDVKVEFAPDRYDSIAKLQGMMITTAAGNTLPLEDLAEIYYQDSPQELSLIHIYADVLGLYGRYADSVRAASDRGQSSVEKP